ncbi:cell wall anchor protein [Marinitenerispora sediminis]|uniref:Cell wall anchor protein n=1 Tax=Marinitenerispora sediminis TaxID=1931232 RepID=A0A368SXS1_9ACTN|nr:cell wall anchor protein [Marinitenerispora sediminis]RCV47314.1 cell wall anchor protein [Marinitenerispora sediminis]RCV47340.1 cell wall anchor protein [Marinitenerispora sediminis]RCV47568.1 cell wall anchor protein [Marinitenerispora sediminis]
MSTAQLWALVGLGIFHGLNPGMGWLLAVSRGMQDGSRAALLRSLPAVAGGHAASVAVFGVAITVTGSLVASRWFAIAGGALVAGAGLWQLLSRRHFRWRGVRMPAWQLAGWSFLMSSVHGAGLMLLPVLAGDLAPAPSVPAPSGHGGHGGHGAHGWESAPPAGAETAPAGLTLADATWLGLTAAGVHTLAMVAATGVAALLVYDFLGSHLLRLSWIDGDRVWAFALVAAGIAVLLTA